MAVKLDPRVKRETIARLKKGDTTKQIVADYEGIPWQTVAKIKREIGLLAPMKRRKVPKESAALSLEEVRQNVVSVITNLEAEKAELLSRVREIDGEIEHATKILSTMD